MKTEPIDPREEPTRSRWEAGDFDGAATLALKLYGPEIFGFLLAMHPHEDAASDVFSIWSERLWRGLPAFRWDCSLRTWVYVVARNASHRYGATEGRRARRNVPLSNCSAVEQMAATVRTETLTYLRTETRSEVERLRASLPPQDQELLILRVDRKLAWSDLARVFLQGGDEGEAASEDALKREAARLRKRFQLIKERLLALGRARGLVPPGEG